MAGYHPAKIPTATIIPRILEIIVVFANIENANDFPENSLNRGKARLTKTSETQNEIKNTNTDSKIKLYCQLTTRGSKCFSNTDFR